MSLIISVVMLVLILALLGFIVNLIVTKIPMDDSFKQLIIVVVVVAIVVYALMVLSGHASLPSVQLPKG